MVPWLLCDTYLLPIPAQVQAELGAWRWPELRARPRRPRCLLLPEPLRVDRTLCASWRRLRRRLFHQGPGFVMLGTASPVDAHEPRTRRSSLYWVLMAFFLRASGGPRSGKGTVIYGTCATRGGPRASPPGGALTSVWPPDAHRQQHGTMGGPATWSLFCPRARQPGGMRSCRARWQRPTITCWDRALSAASVSTFLHRDQKRPGQIAAGTNFRLAFVWDGRLRTRFNARHIVRGDQTRGKKREGGWCPASRTSS